MAEPAVPEQVPLFALLTVGAVSIPSLSSCEGMMLSEDAGYIESVLRHPFADATLPGYVLRSRSFTGLHQKQLAGRQQPSNQPLPPDLGRWAVRKCGQVCQLGRVRGQTECMRVHVTSHCYGGQEMRSSYAQSLCGHHQGEEYPAENAPGFRSRMRPDGCYPGRSQFSNPWLRALEPNTSMNIATPGGSTR